MSKGLEELFATLQATVPGIDGISILDEKFLLVETVGTALLPATLADLQETIPAGTIDPISLPQDADQACRALWQVDPIQDAAQLGVLLLSGELPAEQADALLDYVLRSWSRESNLNKELDTMAEELASRYEELNLAYGSEANINQYEEGQAALRTLVRDCADYLAVDMAVLQVPRKKLSILYRGNKSEFDDPAEITEIVESHLVPFLTGFQESITINYEADPNRESALQGLPCKMTACPLYAPNGDVEGVLAAISSPTSKDFSNSDNNLIEVMSRKASKIITINYDPLTGLFNRQALEYFINRALDSARDKRITHCLLHVDLNRMRIINDTISHLRGDEVIRDAAQIFLGHIRESDIAARMEGAQFGILLENCPLDRGESIARKLNELLAAIIIDDGTNRFEMSSCIGVLRLEHSTESAAAAISSAEVACGAAKELGDGTVQVFARNDQSLARRHEQMRWVAGIQTALRENRFVLFAQRIEPLQDDGSPLHYEILMRLRDVDGSFVSPGEFIPAAERYQLMPAIDRWVVRNTLRELGEHARELEALGVTWAVNLSGQSLIAQDFLPFLMNVVQECALDPRLVGFEITETVAIDDINGAIRFIESVRGLGCPFSLDDFGTGLSSFTYLKALPLDYLKIDGSFVKEILNDRIAHVMVDSIHDVGHVMGLHTIAEFVETEELKEELRKIGITYAQGYCIAKPRPLQEELQDLLNGKIPPVT